MKPSKQDNLTNALNKRLNEDQKGFILKKFLKFRLGVSWLNSLRQFYNNCCPKCQEQIVKNPIEINKKICTRCKKYADRHDKKARPLFEKAGAKFKE